MTAVRREIGDLLVDNGVITQEDLDLVKEEHAKTGDSVVDILSKKGLANENQLKNALELEYGVNFVDLLKTKTRPNAEAVRLLPEEFMRSNRVVGMNLRADKLTLAMVDPSDSHATNAVRDKLPDLQIKPVVCVEDALVTFLDDFFGKTNKDIKETNGGDNSSNEHTAESAKDDYSAKTADLDNPTVAADIAESTTGAAAVGDTQDKESSGQSEPAEPVTAPDEAAEARAKEVEELGTHSQDEIQKSNGKSEAQEDTAANIPIGTTVEDAAEEAAHLHGAGAFSKSKSPTHSRLEAQSVPEADEQVEKAEEEAVVLLANQILGGAIKRGATHIHIIPGEREAVVNYRVGGSLVIDRKLPKTIVTSVINRYKIMAKLNLNEKACLDGHIKVKSASKEIVCLVSIIPTLHGEHAVVWIV
jgi:type II secretory ATPase GspE/PulE/Tfp pilus assembly ATPase PilB-like protein